MRTSVVGLLSALWCLLPAAGCSPVPRDDVAPAEGQGGAPVVVEGEVAAAGLEQFEVLSDGHPMAVWARVPADPHASVLLLHGRTWSSLPDFDLEVEGESLSLMRALADRGIATYALDARGYGATPRDETGWLNPDRMAEDVVVVLDWIAARHAELPTPAMMGWSYGSTVAHLAAQRSPERTSGVALFGYWKHPDVQLPRGAEPEAPPAEATTLEGARSDFITDGSISQRAIDAFVAAALAADPVRVDIRRADEFNALAPDSLQVPTLILQGEFDPIAPPEVQSALFERLGTGHRSWVVLPGCDHAAHIERCMPRFVRTLSGFVREVAGG